MRRRRWRAYPTPYASAGKIHPRQLRASSPPAAVTGRWVAYLLIAHAYEPGLWSIVFPVGMYGVASRELGAALRVSWLVTLGRVEAWVALAVWAVVFLAMAGALAWRSARLPATGAPGSG